MAATTKKNKGGATGKYTYWLTEEGLSLITAWARDGLNNDDIAKNIGIASKTLYEWQHKYGEISNALKKGKETSDYIIENALFKKAESGDMTAIIFWLANRRPNKWKRNPDLHTSDKAEPIEIILRRD